MCPLLEYDLSQVHVGENHRTVLTWQLCNSRYDDVGDNTRLYPAYMNSNQTMGSTLKRFISLLYLLVGLL